MARCASVNSELRDLNASPASIAATRVTFATDNNAYAEAIVLVRRIKKLMAESGDGTEFQRYLDTLRADFKPKRNLMKMLDEFRR